MIALGQDVAEPETDEGADTGTLPGPVRRDMGIDQVADAHLLDDPQEEGHTVNLFIGKRKRGGRLLHIRWCGKAHGMCDHLLMVLTSSTVVPCCGTQSVHPTTSDLNWGIDLRE
jgi:hypothetical protein